MIYEGLIEEAFAIVKGARDRYDGIPRAPIGRNPWNEIECGGHYARAMSSWSILTGAAGYEYDGVSKRVRFTPRVTPEKFKSFFVGPEGWGSLDQARKSVPDEGVTAQANMICVIEGRLVVSDILLDPLGDVVKSELMVHLDAKDKAIEKIDATFELQPGGILVKLAAPVTIKAGQELTISFPSVSRNAIPQ